MGVRLTTDGLEQIVGDAVFASIAWADIRTIEATCSDHMTQRVPMLTFSSATETIDVGEGEFGWDELLGALADHVRLEVPDLLAVVATLRTDETVTLLRP